MVKLLVATHNLGKIREYAELLADLPVRLSGLAAEGIGLEVEETGATMAENAILKARAYADASGLLTWADDSGLEVDALGGAPGVRSARYGGDGATDADRYRLLLDNLSEVPWDRRTARFRCIVALAQPGGAVVTAEGVCEGLIAFAPRGHHGFGYDPVFFLPDRGQTMAELPPEEKHRISHRGQAARAAKRLLAAQLPLSA